MNKSLNLIQNSFKELPNNIEAEQSVIGSILTQNEIFDEITGIISDKNFFDPLHQKIFESIQNLIYKGLLANPITLKNYFLHNIKISFLQLLAGAVLKEWIM